MSGKPHFFVYLLPFLSLIPMPVTLAGYKITPFATHVQVTNNPAFGNFSAEIISTTRENRINVDYIVLQPIQLPRLVVVLWLNVGSGALQAPFYNQTIDFCSLIKNPGSHRLVQIVYREMRRHGNMPTGCPIPATVYKIHGVSTSQMRLPPFFTHTDFMVDIIGLAGAAKTHIFDTRWYGTLNRVKCTAAERC